jgi:predicted GTPase
MAGQDRTDNAVPQPQSASRDAVIGLVTAAADTCMKWGRPDLERRLRVALRRIERSLTAIGVVGEFKQGKSALVNGLLGADVCPVDDDFATAATTWIYQSESPEARIRRVVDGRLVVEEIDPDDLVAYVSESGNPDNHLRVEIAEIGLQNPALDRGLTIVDTPGAGGAKAARNAAILGFLPHVDTLIFTSDASAELSAPEVEFLKAAQEVCPTVLVALTKIDLYPAWRRIAEINAGHLAAAEMAAEPIPVSAVLRAEGLRRDDAQLDQESGFPALLDAISTEVLHRSDTIVLARALGEVRAGIGQLLVGAEAERRALADPEAGERMAAELQQAGRTLAELRGAGSRWMTVLNDKITDLIQQNDYGIKTGIQAVLTDLDTALEESDPAAVWADLTASVQAQLADLVGSLFRDIESSAGEIGEQIAALLRDEGALPSSLSSDADLNIEALWSARDRSAPNRDGGPSTVWAAVRGGSSGVITLGVIGGLAGLALAGPLAIGAGVAFASKQMVDERKRRVEKRRREARTVVQQFLGQVQMELGTRTRQMIQELHRTMRDHFAQRVAELDASASAALAAIQESLRETESGRRERLPGLESAIDKLKAMIDRAEALHQEVNEGTRGE